MAGLLWLSGRAASPSSCFVMRLLMGVYFSCAQSYVFSRDTANESVYKGGVYMRCVSGRVEIIAYSKGVRLFLVPG